MVLSAIKKLQQFLSYWYLRYLLATELYMVEPWERTVVNILFVTVFGAFWYFNHSIITSGIFGVTNSNRPYLEQES